MNIELHQLELKWPTLLDFLSPDSFRRLADAPKIQPELPPLDYPNIKPPSEITVFRKQAAKRHHGVHGYFTRQVWSVVQKYIETFTRPGDLVLDPFGGSGVTFIESLILGRKAIHIDINPLSKFVVETLASGVDIGTLVENFNRVVSEYSKKRPKTNADIDAILDRLPYPKGIVLPASSDVTTIEQLFDRRQLAELALLKSIIIKIKDDSSRRHLLLMFSGLLNKVNLTYHASEGRSEGRGDSAIFRYYRYRIAHTSPRLDVVRVFRSRLKKILAAKEELRPFLSKLDMRESRVLQGSATAMNGIKDRSVDYIYADPPYGAKIPYLDLSTMWNSWLDLAVSPKDFADEAIEGGELKKTKKQYSDLIAASIKEMYRVLKFNRWLTFVFAHKDPAYWHLIVDSAEKAGFEYAGAVRQNNGQTSFKKRQNPFTVLSGQLIINFKKVANPKSILAAELRRLMQEAKLLQEAPGQERGDASVVLVRPARRGASDMFSIEVRVKPGRESELRSDLTRAERIGAKEWGKISRQVAWFSDKEAAEHAAKEYAARYPHLEYRVVAG